MYIIVRENSRMSHQTGVGTKGCNVQRKIGKTKIIEPRKTEITGRFHTDLNYQLGKKMIIMNNATNLRGHSLKLSESQCNKL